MKIIPRLERFNPNFYYKTGFDIDHSIYIEDKSILFTNKMNRDYAKKISKSKKLKIKDIKDFTTFIKTNKDKITFLDFEGSGVKLFLKIKKELQGKSEIRDYSEEILNKRMKKRGEEVVKIKKAREIALNIIEGIEVKEGNKEKEIENKLKIEAIKKGVELSFDPIVADIKNARFPHYKTGNKKVKKAVLIDFGVKYEHYCSDITRVIFLKEDKELKEKYERIKDIFYELYESIKEGCVETAGDLSLKSKELYKKKRIKEPPHLIGHGIGLDVHEYPFLHLKNKQELEDTTIAIEPANYDKVGLRYEDDIYIGKNKVEIL